MAMWKFKNCPRCQGDVSFEEDEYGWYEWCLQCGYLRDLESIAEFKGRPAEGTKEPALAGRSRAKNTKAVRKGKANG